MDITKTPKNKRKENMSLERRHDPGISIDSKKIRRWLKTKQFELLVFFSAFVSFTIALFVYMNIPPCSDFFCFQGVDLLFSYAFFLMGGGLLITYFYLLIKRLKQKTEGKNKTYLLFIITIILIFLPLANMITFAERDEHDLMNGLYDTKRKIAEVMVWNLHLCYASDYFNHLDYAGYSKDCYAWWAETLGTEVFCEQSDHYDDACYGRLAIIKKDYKICEKVTRSNMFDDCIEPYISKTGDLRACDLIGKEDYKTTGYDEEEGYFYNMFKKQFDSEYEACVMKRNPIYDLSVCLGAGISETQCRSTLSTLNDDYTLCYGIDDGKNQDRCLYNAIRIPVDCNSSTTANGLCLYKTAIDTLSQDPDDCLQITDDKYRNRCLFYVSLGTENYDACSLIDGEFNIWNDIGAYDENRQEYYSIDTTSETGCKDAILSHKKTKYLKKAQNQLHELRDKDLIT